MRPQPDQANHLMEVQVPLLGPLIEAHPAQAMVPQVMDQEDLLTDHHPMAPRPPIQGIAPMVMVIGIDPESPNNTRYRVNQSL